LRNRGAQCAAWSAGVKTSRYVEPLISGDVCGSAGVRRGSVRWRQCESLALREQLDGDADLLPRRGFWGDGRDVGGEGGVLAEEAGKVAVVGARDVAEQVPAPADADGEAVHRVAGFGLEEERFASGEKRQAARARVMAEARDGKAVQQQAPRCGRGGQRACGEESGGEASERRCEESAAAGFWERRGARIASGWRVIDAQRSGRRGR
jgi:hypothetical protein